MIINESNSSNVVDDPLHASVPCVPLNLCLVEHSLERLKSLRPNLVFHAHLQTQTRLRTWLVLDLEGRPAKVYGKMLFTALNLFDF